MMQFYDTYKDAEIVSTLLRQIGWRSYGNCVTLGKRQRMCHVVASHDDDFIYLITAYYPDEKIWKEDLKSRKENV